MIQCPYCDHPKARVVDTRDGRGGTRRRRRICESCNQRYSTVERVVEFVTPARKMGTWETVWVPEGDHVLVLNPTGIQGIIDKLEDLLATPPVSNDEAAV